MTEMNANLEDTQREQCFRSPDLLGTCVCCLKIFEKRQHNQITCGAERCRKSRQQYAIRAHEHKANDGRRWERRRAKSMMDLVNVDRWSPKTSRDNYKEATKKVRENVNRHSRCTQCGKEFVDENDKPLISSFEFCGESLLLSSPCKKAWIEAHPINLVLPEKKPVASDALDEERLANGKRIHAPAKVNMGRRKLNYCPLCREYVNQDHEHVSQ